MTELPRYDEMTAIVAARLVADQLAIDQLDDRILQAYRNIMLPAHEKAVREQVAREIEARANTIQGYLPMPTLKPTWHDRADALRHAAAIARGGDEASR